MSAASSYLSGSILPHSEGGTYSGDYVWYIFSRSCLVYIRAITPGTHSGGYAWYTFSRSCLVYISTVNDITS